MLLNYRNPTMPGGYPRVKPFAPWADFGTYSVACFTGIFGIGIVSGVAAALVHDFDAGLAGRIFAMGLGGVIVLLALAGTVLGLLGLVLPGRVRRRGWGAVGFCLNGLIVLMMLEIVFGGRGG